MSEKKAKKWHPVIIHVNKKNQIIKSKNDNCKAKNSLTIVKKKTYFNV
jgi:aspartate 1-decarboxylase